jgi:hypothetical protein
MFIFEPWNGYKDVFKYEFLIEQIKNVTEFYSIKFYIVIQCLTRHII